MTYLQGVSRLNKHKLIKVGQTPNETSNDVLKLIAYNIYYLLKNILLFQAMMLMVHF